MTIWLQRHRRRLIIAVSLVAAYTALVAMKPQWVAALMDGVVILVYPFAYAELSACGDNLELCRAVGSPMGLINFNMTPAAYWGSFVAFAAVCWLVVIVLRRVERRQLGQRNSG